MVEWDARCTKMGGGGVGDIKIWLLKVIKLERENKFSFYTAHDLSFPLKI